MRLSTQLSVLPIHRTRVVVKLTVHAVEKMGHSLHHVADILKIDHPVRQGNEGTLCVPGIAESTFGHQRTGLAAGVESGVSALESAKYEGHHGTAGEEEEKPE